MDNHSADEFVGGSVLFMADEGLGPRVSALEGEMREIRARLKISEQDAAAARVLAGAADRDVGEIRSEMRDFRRATVSSFNALREDLVDLRAEMRSGFDEMRSGFDEVRSGFDLTAAGQRQIVDLLQTLIDGRDR